MVVFDCNLLPEVIGAILASSEQLKIHSVSLIHYVPVSILNHAPAFCDPTSVRKLPRLIPALIANTPRGPKAACPLTHLSPNMLELDLLYASLASTHPEIEELTWEYINSLNLLADWRAKLETFTSPAEREWIRQTGAVQKMVACLPFVSSIWLKASHRGLLHLHIAVTPPSGTMPNSILHRLPDSRGGYLILTYYAAHSLPADEIVSTTGAGDTLVGGLVAGLMNGGDELGWVEKALDRVGRTIQSRRAVG